MAAALLFRGKHAESSFERRVKAAICIAALLYAVKWCFSNKGITVDRALQKGTRKKRIYGYGKTRLRKESAKLQNSDPFCSHLFTVEDKASGEQAVMHEILLDGIPTEEKYVEMDESHYYQICINEQRGHALDISLKLRVLNPRRDYADANLFVSSRSEFPSPRNSDLMSQTMGSDTLRFDTNHWALAHDMIREGPHALFVAIRGKSGNPAKYTLEARLEGLL